MTLDQLPKKIYCSTDSCTPVVYFEPAKDRAELDRIVGSYYGGIKGAFGRYHYYTAQLNPVTLETYWAEDLLCWHPDFIRVIQYDHLLDPEIERIGIEAHCWMEEERMVVTEDVYNQEKKRFFCNPVRLLNALISAKSPEDFWSCVEETTAE